MQRFAFDIVHSNKGQVRFFADIVHSDNVRVGESSRCFCLAEKAGSNFIAFIFADFTRQHHGFYSHGATDLFISPKVNHSHCTAPDLAVDLNSKMPQALNNMAVIHHHLGSLAEEKGDADLADRHFDQAADLWTKAIRLAPNNYIEAQNWLKTSGRGSVDVYF